MNVEHYDLIVLGSGSAARDGAGKAAREHGARVALIEHWLWGGSCPNVACRPTKAYVVAAELMHDVRHHAAERGIDLPEPAVRLAQTRKWKDSIRRDQQSWVQTLKDAGYGVVPGTASFVDARTVRVGDQQLSGDRILVATGSRTAVPPIPGIEDIEWIDHVTALELEEVPESLLVVGAGPVGLEFAQIFARFGSRVTIVNSGPQIAARADTEAAGELQAALEEEGIEVVLNSGVDSFARSHDGIAASVGGRTVDVSHVLLASGRLPNVEELEPDRIGLEVGRGGITVDDRQRTNVDGVWAAGDVAAGPMLTPIAQYQARIAVEDMFADGLPACRLLGAADRDLHGSRARRRRADRGGGCGAGPRRRRRQASAAVRHARAIHRREARSLQDRLRSRNAPGARRPRRLARGKRHRRQHHAGPEARRHRGRPRLHAPRLPELQRGPEGGC